MAQQFKAGDRVMAQSQAFGKPWVFGTVKGVDKAWITVKWDEEWPYYDDTGRRIVREGHHPPEKLQPLDPAVMAKAKAARQAEGRKGGVVDLQHLKRVVERVVKAQGARVLAWEKIPDVMGASRFKVVLSTDAPEGLAAAIKAAIMPVFPDGPARQWVNVEQGGKPSELILTGARQVAFEAMGSMGALIAERWDAYMRHCVAGVTKGGKAKARAFAICKAGGNKAGYYVPGTKKVTAKGKKAMRAHARDAAAAAKDVAYERAIKKEEAMTGMRQLIEAQSRMGDLSEGTDDYFKKAQQAFKDAYKAMGVACEDLRGGLEETLKERGAFNVWVDFMVDERQNGKLSVEVNGQITDAIAEEIYGYLSTRTSFRHWSVSRGAKLYKASTTFGVVR
jgi:hypothetical protein